MVMGKNRKLTLNFLSGLSIGLIVFIAFVDYLKNTSILFMPKEYKTLKKIVDKLASTNDLSYREIPFTITSGGYTGWIAEELGLCKDDGCYYFSNLDPYKNHSKINGININELINQSNLLNGIEAYAWSGAVWISKSSFQATGEEEGFIACTIGHELSHIFFNDHIQQSIKLSNILKNTNEESFQEFELYLVDKIGIYESTDLIGKELNFFELKDLTELYLSRESESLADINGSRMVINAGYERDICLKELTFFTETGLYPTDTELDSTHPGYLERYESLEMFINNYVEPKDIISYESYKWKWIYNRRLNTLIFKPIN